MATALAMGGKWNAAIDAVGTTTALALRPVAPDPAMLRRVSVAVPRDDDWGLIPLLAASLVAPGLDADSDHDPWGDQGRGLLANRAPPLNRETADAREAWLKELPLQ